MPRLALIPSLPQYAEASQIIGTLNSFIGLINSGLGSRLYSAIATGSTGADTTEDTLQSYTLPANAFITPGQVITIRATGHMATNGNNKTIKVYFGSEVISSGTLTDSNKNWYAEMIVTARTAAVQQVNANMLHDTTWITPYDAAGAEDATATITIKVTGQSGTGTAADITCDQFVVSLAT